jgi:hypothetical protein
MHICPTTTGVSNLSALSTMVATQTVEYDFEFSRVPFHTDVQVCVLSEGKSMLPVSRPHAMSPPSLDDVCRSMCVCPCTCMPSPSYRSLMRRSNACFVSTSQLCPSSGIASPKTCRRFVHTHNPHLWDPGSFSLLSLVSRPLALNNALS